MILTLCLFVLFTIIAILYCTHKFYYDAHESYAYFLKDNFFLNPAYYFFNTLFSVVIAFLLSAILRPDFYCTYEHKKIKNFKSNSSIRYNGCFEEGVYSFDLETKKNSNEFKNVILHDDLVFKHSNYPKLIIEKRNIKNTFKNKIIFIILDDYKYMVEAPNFNN